MSMSRCRRRTRNLFPQNVLLRLAAVKCEGRYAVQQKLIGVVVGDNDCNIRLQRLELPTVFNG